MSLEFASTLFSGSKWDGHSLLVGVGQNDRYSPMTSSDLLAQALLSNIGSVEIVTTGEADGEVILFQSPVPFPNFQGEFLELGAAASFGEALWNFDWSTQSVLLVASNRKGHSEMRLSFAGIFLNQWDTFVDQELGGGPAKRQGDPTLTWEMFPIGIDHLDSNGTYLKIFQPLTISLPWPWDEYAASMTYHIGLFVDGNSHLRCWGQRWAYWIEGGAKTGHIESNLKPKVIAGLGTLVTQVNQKLMELDALGPLTDVYYLPGTQTSAIGTSTLTGNTFDDVTIVVEH